MLGEREIRSSWINAASLVATILLFCGVVTAKDNQLSLAPSQVYGELAKALRSNNSAQVTLVDGTVVTGRITTVDQYVLNVRADAGASPSLQLIPFDKLSEIRLVIHASKTRKVLGTIGGVYALGAVGALIIMGNDSTGPGVTAVALTGLGGYVGYKLAAKHKSTLVINVR